MAGYVRVGVVDSGPSADTVKSAVLDVDTDLTGVVAAYNVHDTATTSVHGFTGTKTGSGAMVGATSPTLVTPNLGTPSAIVLTNASGTVTSLTLVTPALGTPASGTLTNCTGLPTGGVTMAATAKVLGRATAGAGVAEEIATTGTGSVVLATSPTISSPTLTGTVDASGATIASPTLTDATTRTNYDENDSPVTLTTANCNGFNLITNTGAGAAVEFDLPAGGDGLSGEFEVTAAQYLKVVANGTETIGYGATAGAAGGYVRSATVGTRWKLTWDGTRWSIHDLVGILNYDE